ncbi:hypothetical protein [Sediminibacterium ginsengisoli]|uniref:LTXXQ motif family protein n=1 Tax=Sediminibacterium ginsengisoli TaxID=413434 RepID=A0A1T4NNE3_9BACT|nr:hypothetical protein [Sediminibacterium ginsengisoli]SJZ80625.1 hypothetical protein SAMN04488132_104326 [Sediminibacterium ginsengisoli]
MKKFFYLLLIAAGISAGAAAQPGGGGGANVQGLKIAFVTRQLDLNSDEAQKFWPVYYDYSDELKDLRKTEKTVDVLVFEEKVLNLRKKYKAEFKKILGTEERANKALTIDRDFNAVVKKELAQRAEARRQQQPRNN